MGIQLKFLGATFLLLCAGVIAEPAWAQSSCKALDPEIAGAYKGDCRNGLANGYGEATGSAAAYRGEFRDGRKNGKGVKQWTNGDRYEGSFADDRKEGDGVYTWGPGGPAAGERYAGTFHADRRHGRGVYSWPSGDRYEGDWADDVPTGRPTPGMVARARHEAEVEASMAGAGGKVCRYIPIGISEQDLVIGTILESKAGELTVRIDDPGRFPNTLNGTRLASGVVLHDAVAAWTACR
jgi:hypothetical protein